MIEVKKIHEACDKEEFWRAKQILQGRLVNSGYHEELFLLYGQVLLKMGDKVEAGKFLFLSGERINDYADSIALFISKYSKTNFSNFWSRMPVSARSVSRHSIPSVVMLELEEYFCDKEITSTFDKIEKQIEKKQNSDTYVSENIPLSIWFVLGLILFVFMAGIIQILQMLWTLWDLLFVWI